MYGCLRPPVPGFYLDYINAVDVWEKEWIPGAMEIQLLKFFPDSTPVSQASSDLK